MFFCFLLLSPGVTNPGEPFGKPAQGPLPHQTFLRHCSKWEVGTGLGRWPHPIAGTSLYTLCRASHESNRLLNMGLRICIMDPWEEEVTLGLPLSQEMLAVPGRMAALGFLEDLALVA